MKTRTVTGRKSAMTVMVGEAMFKNVESGGKGYVSLRGVYEGTVKFIACGKEKLEVEQLDFTPFTEGSTVMLKSATGTFAGRR